MHFLKLKKVIWLKGWGIGVDAPVRICVWAVPEQERIAPDKAGKSTAADSPG